MCNILSKSKMNLKILILILSIKCVYSVYNFSDEIQSKCKRYDCRSGYNYADFFKVIESHTSENNTFEIHLAIKAPANGHILLSPSTYPDMTVPVYEITVGAGKNSFSELRRMRMKFGKSTVTTENILDPNKFVPFWITISKDGTVRFGKEGSDIPILFYRDPQPLQVKYFSFASWSNIEAQILYDCPVGENITDESILVEKILTPSEKLRKSLLTGYDRSVIPIQSHTSTMSVQIHDYLRYVKYDVSTGNLKTLGKIQMKWYDEKINWVPDDFENRTKINFSHKELWTPEIVIYDSLELVDFKIQDMPLVVDHYGTVTHHLLVETKTTCVPSKSLAHWPRDEHVCTLRFGLWSEQSNVVLLPLNTNQSKQKLLDTSQRMDSEWELYHIEVTSEVTKYSPYATIFEVKNNYHNTVNMKLYIRRKYKFLSLTLHSPYIWHVLVILITFWISASPGIKTSILCLDLILIMYSLSCIVDRMPLYVPHIPNLVIFYLCAIFGICICIIVNVLLVYIKTEPKPWPIMNETLKKFLISSPITNALGMPEIKMKETYHGLEEENLEKQEEDNDEQIWEMLVLLIDRLMFIIYTIVFATIMFMNF